MKLRNKKTREIIEFDKAWLADNDNTCMQVNSLAELNKEWEDYEGPEGWCVTMYGGITRIAKDDEPFISDLKEIGNYFNDKESAYDALDKLKAWKRLKDKGFKTEGWTIDDGLRVSICTNLNSDGIYDEDRKETKKELDICFGGEE